MTGMRRHENATCSRVRLFNLYFVPERGKGGAYLD